MAIQKCSENQDAGLPRCARNDAGRGLFRISLGAHLNRIAASLVALIVILAPVAAEAVDPCAYDKEAMLSLSENAFDQNLANGGGGWRAVAKISGCERAAAGLLAAYRAAHPGSDPMLAWHEGQALASAGEYADAIPLLESARKPEDQDLTGWNHYVDATVAFLRHDKAVLLAARQHLTAIKYPIGAGFPPLNDGYVEFRAPAGQPPVRFRWPPNIEVVDALVVCFNRPYEEAYGPTCRNRGS